MDKKKKVNIVKVYKEKNKLKTKKIYDGTITNITSKNIQQELLKGLEKIKKLARLNYKHLIDFTLEKEYEDLINEKDLDKIKEKMNKYINMIKKVQLCPLVELNNFRNKYLEELVKIQHNLEDILILEKNPEKIVLFKQESYESEPYIKSPSSRAVYRHKTDQKKSKVIINNMRFDIEDVDDL